MEKLNVAIADDNEKMVEVLRTRYGDLYMIWSDNRRRQRSGTCGKSA